MSVFSNQDKEVLGNSANEWTVVYEEENVDFTPSPLNRVIRVIAFEKIEDILPSIKPYRSFLQTVGMAASPKELFRWAERLGGDRSDTNNGFRKDDCPRSGLAS